MKPLFRTVIIAIFALSIISPYSAEAKTKRSKALIISGQNNHNWQVSHRVLKLILEQSGLFECDIMLTATAGGDMSSFTPNFEKYDVVVLDYNGDRWPKQTDEAFLQYVKRGGGVVVYHAADNAFAGWEEFNRIVWCAQAAPDFARGMVDGYFDGNVPLIFWKLLALYICSNTLSSLPWAIPFGEQEISVMRRQAAEVLSWYQNMETVIPSWYEKRG